MKEIVIEKQAENIVQKAGNLLRSQYGLWTLAIISFVESALLLPIVTDPFLIAYILAEKKSVYKGVIVTLVASVLGGIFAYIIAFYFYEYIAAQYIHGVTEDYLNVAITGLQDGVFIIVILGAITPIPYTLIAFGAGFVKVNIFIFIIASIVGRGGRYAVVGFATYMFGEKALEIIQKRLLIISTISFISAGIYFFLKW